MKTIALLIVFSSPLFACKRFALDGSKAFLGKIIANIKESQIGADAREYSIKEVTQKNLVNHIKLTNGEKCVILKYRAIGKGNCDIDVKFFGKTKC